MPECPFSRFASHYVKEFHFSSLYIVFYFCAINPSLGTSSPLISKWKFVHSVCLGCSRLQHFVSCTFLRIGQENIIFFVLFCCNCRSYECKIRLLSSYILYVSILVSNWPRVFHLNGNICHPRYSWLCLPNKFIHNYDVIHLSAKTVYVLYWSVTLLYTVFQMVSESRLSAKGFSPLFLLSIANIFFFFQNV